MMLRSSGFTGAGPVRHPGVLAVSDAVQVAVITAIPPTIVAVTELMKVRKGSSEDGPPRQPRSRGKLGAIVLGTVLVTVAFLLAAIALTSDDGPSGLLADMTPVADANFQDGGKSVQLTPAKTNGVGAVWTAERHDISGGFRAELTFRITRPHGRGSDGLAFVIQDESSRALGDFGGGLGYSGIPGSFAVEFDTWQNLGEFTERDPDDNHIALHTRGAQPNSSDHRFALASWSAIPALADGRPHVASVRYDGNLLEVCVDRSPCLRHPVDLPEQVGSSHAWIGVTAGTGNRDVAEIHEVLAFSFEEGAGD